MKIHVLSDLHREFEAYEPCATALAQADVVVLAGDIDLGAKGVEWAQKAFAGKPVIYVLGNHEYYRHTYPKLARELEAAARGTHVHVLENRSVTLGEVAFHGATLWTDYELFGDPRLAGFECQQRMTDFRKIRREPNYSKLRTVDAALIHKRSLLWLKDSAAASEARYQVVVTHHAPSMRSVESRFQNDILTAAYASHLEPVIESLGADLWLHGHLHNSSDYRVGDCRVLCNPRGYPMERNPGFDSGLLVELGGG